MKYIKLIVITVIITLFVNGWYTNHLEMMERTRLSQQSKKSLHSVQYKHENPRPVVEKGESKKEKHENRDGEVLV